MKKLEEFLDALGQRESGGNYKAFNKYGYAGKYQMGEAALIDAGYYKKNGKYNNDWSGIFTGVDNIHSIYLKAIGADKFTGKYINGYCITQSGLLAGAHLKGAGGVNDYLKSNGSINPKDAFGTSVEDYIKNFAGYDVSSICR